jgi:hypothetical protein
MPNKEPIMNTRSSWSVCVVLGLMLAACGGEPDGSSGHPDRGTGGNGYREGGTSYYNGLEPGSWAPLEAGSSHREAGFREAGSTEGGVATCPASATCSPACGANQTCIGTKSSGNTCAPTLELIGKPFEAANMAPLARAVVACWNKQANGMCYGVKACQLSGNINAVCPWICKTATLGDFNNSSADFDTAKSICVCTGAGLNRVQFSMSIFAGTNGKICMWWDGAWWKQNNVYINYCSSY